MTLVGVARKRENIGPSTDFHRRPPSMIMHCNSGLSIRTRHCLLLHSNVLVYTLWVLHANNKSFCCNPNSTKLGNRQYSTSENKTDRIKMRFTFHYPINYKYWGLSGVTSSLVNICLMHFFLERICCITFFKTTIICVGNKALLWRNLTPGYFISWLDDPSIVQPQWGNRRKWRKRELKKDPIR